MEWSDEAILRLRALWGEGHSTAEIGRRLQITKNAVVGKAHRLKLSARPSPIRRSGDQPKLSRPLQPVPPSTVMLIARPAALVPSAQPESVVRVVRSVARPSGRTVPCCWPLGEPGTKGFRFCDATSIHGKPYCLEHAAIAYVRIRDRREDAA